jgi:hypothetical protein
MTVSEAQKQHRFLPPIKVIKAETAEEFANEFSTETLALYEIKATFIEPRFFCCVLLKREFALEMVKYYAQN